MISRHIERKVFIGIIFSLILVICCGGCSSSTESSPDVSTPQYKTFVTKAEFTGNIATDGEPTTDIANADALCMNDDYKPAGSSTYKAMLVDGTNRVACTTALCSGGTSEHIDWVLQPNAEYYRSDGTTLILKTNANGIFDFGANLTNSFDTSASTYFTGLMGDWTSSGHGQTCGGLTYFSPLS